MKSLNLMLLLFLLGGSAVAQTSSGTQDAPGVVVVENRWRRSERNFKLEEDPLIVNQQQDRLQRAQQETIRDNAALARVNQQAKPIPTQVSVPTKTMPVKPWVEYFYEIKVSNTGTKTIRKLVWEYVSSTSGAQPTVGRRRFISKAKIRPGKTKKLVESSVFPPLAVIDATQADQKTQGQSPERVVIQSIEYTDGSVWTRDSE